MARIRLGGWEGVDLQETFFYCHRSVSLDVISSVVYPRSRWWMWYTMASIENGFPFSMACCVWPAMQHLCTLLVGPCRTGCGGVCISGVRVSPCSPRYGRTGLCSWHRWSLGLIDRRTGLGWSSLLRKILSVCFYTMAGPWIGLA